MKSWQYFSLAAWLKGLNVEVILISGLKNSEIRINLTLTYLPGWQTVRISFRKISNKTERYEIDREMGR